MTDILGIPPIEEAGVYDIPIEVYHGQPCSGPSITATGLKTIAHQSLAHYWSQSPLNPHPAPREPSAALDLGAAAHSLILENNLPSGRFVESPFDDFRTKRARAWRDEAIAEGKAILKPDDMRKIAGMAISLAKHPLVMAGALRGDVEKSLFWRHELDPSIWIGSRPDVIPEDITRVDLKTTASATRDFMQRQTINCGYHIQAAVSVDGARIVLGRKIEAFVILAVETEEPHACVAFEMTDDLIAAGMAEYRDAAAKFADAVKRQAWPGPDDGRLVLPLWKKKQLIEKGLLDE